MGMICDEVHDHINLSLLLLTCSFGDDADKRPGDQLFDTFDANDLNKRLRELMDGLSAKVRWIATCLLVWPETLYTPVT